MANTKDMSAPVTRGELREEIERLEVRLEARLDARLEARLASMASRADLEIWGGALLARMNESMAAMEQRLLAELGRHTKALCESMSTLISGVDDKYKQLPGRVDRLETAVFGAEPR